MPDGSNIHTLPTSRQVAKLASLRPAEVIQHPQSNVGTYGFPPVGALPRKRFHTTGDGAVRLGLARLAPDVVEELMCLFQREAGRTSDWTLFDDLQAARDGLSEPPPAAA